MAGQDELAQLEAERDRLLSMIAYHDGPVLQTSPWFQIPPWLRWVAVGMICGIGALIVAGIVAGQIALSGLVFSVVFLGLAAYILTRKITVFGINFRVGDTLTGWPTRQPAGEPEARRHLADCEARIMKLKESRL
jgi:hypothetical protein